MSLHRASKKPDWESIPAAEQTSFQRIAANSGGVLTPANLITVIGFAIVIYGLTFIMSGHYWIGLLLLAFGRLLDIADGLVAEGTGTKSHLGEIFDAAADKIGTLLTILVFVVAGITSWWVIAALVIPQIIIPLVILYKKQKGIAVHPTRPGKVSMALTWVGIVGLLVVKAFGDPVALATGIYVIIGLSLLLGLYALWQYSTGRD
ncbi:MAG: CDP-diacylglycerol--glycerol-3-phosphate 3-phosphatidyltransferase [Candidatus Saccharibacteria bacterium]|nr:CDP-diacylglycerol--glycerol-3-phosphate 3-phosphatidyltransferase [Candidatus Saccharibacteria bacterium]MDB5180533.1 CDP-diacylglycerol--glycerol-3-phosphate 3-phosphatidyltransferase [Candidatus Saccharibacteria bacterium]